MLTKNIFRGSLPYMACIDMCGYKGYSVFLDVYAKIINRSCQNYCQVIDFGHFGLK